MVILPSFAQTLSDSADYKITIRHFTTKEGLSHNAINDVYQDSRNLYWITTRHGLNQFDGHEFKLYTKEKNGLHRNILDAIYEEKKSADSVFSDEGRMIWLLTGQGSSDEWFVKNNTFGYSIFNPYTEQVISAEAYLGEELFNHLKNLEAYEVCENYLLLLTSTGHIIKYYHRSKVEIIQLKEPDEQLFFYKKLSNQQCWVGFREGVNRKLQRYIESPQNIKEQTSYLLERHSDAPETPINDIHIVPTNDKSDSLWFTTSIGTLNLKAFFCLLPTGETISIPYHDLMPNLPQKQVLNLIYYDAYDHLFWLTDGEQKTYIVHREKKLVFSLDFPLKEVCLKDEQELFWTANNNGLKVIQVKKTPFQKRLDGLGVRGIVLDHKKNIWAYPNFIEGRAMTGDSFMFNYKRILASHSLTKNEDETIQSFCTQNNKLWLGSFTKENDGKATLLPVNLPPTGIWSIYNDKESGLFWGGGERGMLFNYHPDTKKTTLFEQFNGFDALKEATIYQFKPDGLQLVWLATSNGLYLLHKTKGIVARYWDEGQGEFHLPVDAVHHIYIDKENTFWLGSRGAGLLELKLVNNKLQLIHQFTVVDGLPSNGIHAIYEDDYGYLWLNTENQIVQFHKTTHFSSNYSVEDGIAHSEGNRISHYQDKEGRLYFGSIEGITVFHPKDFLQEPDIKRKYIHIVDLEQYSASKQYMESRMAFFSESQKIVLSSTEGRVELTLNEPFTLGVKSVFYTYQIKGLHPKPISLFQPKMTISDVPFGKYTLELKAYNSKGNLLDKKKIPLISKPPYYLQWWFLGLLLILSGLLTYLFAQYRTKVLVKQKALLEAEVLQRTQQLEADKIIIEQQASELKELDETKSRFFANVSHELRTPIQLIQGPIQSILKMNILDNKNFTLLSKAEQNSKNLLRLVNEILDLTKLDANKLTLNEETVVFYLYLRRIISNFQSIADAKSIHFTFIYHPKETLQIELDTDKFEKILSNLFTNAIKFTPENGKISVIIESHDSHLILKVQDNGRGIPETDMPYIFDRFYQSSINKKAEGGMGIGLALSMEFVKLMNGKMWAESVVNASNQGSVFYFQFLKKEVLTMLSTKDQIAITSEDFSNEKPNTIEKKDLLTPLTAPHQTILLVEDNVDLREYIQFLLEPRYKIIMAGNGQEALKQLSIVPDLILSDIMMPIMDGFEFLETIKANASWRNIPFIMLTARAELKDKLKALRIGVDDYLLKPFKEEELLVRIENLLTNAEERKEFAQAEMVHSANSDNTVEEPSNISKIENKWLEQIENLILENLTDSRFSVDYLAELLAINRKTLYQKIKVLTGLTPNQYIRTIRLQYAKEGLEKGKYTSVKAAANDVGFMRPDYFSKLYVKAFGKAPVEYL